MNDCSLELERILGLTTLNNSSLLTAKNSVVYVAGCVAVRHSIDDSKQKQFFQAQHAIACIALTADENYLAVGERGHNPKILIFEVSSGKLVVSLENHKHGIGSMAFSPDGRYLVSASFKVDKQLCIWDWRSRRIVSSHKIGNKVNAIAFHYSGNYFVTCGDRHLKWWHILYEDDGTMLGVTGQPAAILDTHAQSNFVDVVLMGSESKEEKANAYVITSSGILCLFSSETRMMSKWEQIQTSSSYCLSFHHAVVTTSKPVSSGQAAACTFEYLFVGCANGAILCFSANSLKYVAALPLPAPLSTMDPRGSASSALELENGDISISHPACTGVRVMRHTTHHAGKGGGKADTSVMAFGKKFPVNAAASTTATLLVAVYADHSFFIWDIGALFVPPNYPFELRKDMKDVSPRYVRLQSHVFHRSCIWDLQFIDSIFGGSDGTDPTEDDTLDETAAILERGAKRGGKQLLLPTGTMVTGSTDGSIRFWNMSAPPRSTQLSSGGQNAHAHLMWKSPYSRDMLHSIDIGSSSSADSASSAIDNSKNNSRRPYVAISAASDPNSSTLSGTASTNPAAGASNIDLSNPTINSELPDRYQDDVAARAFCIHPSHDHVACGDKFGAIRVYNIVTMALVQTIHAHVAEVLTMCYSPWMYYHAADDSAVGASTSSGTTGGWTVNRISSVHSNGVPPLLLLATAGRDRLIHVLDASKPGHYTPLVTLDNHSASVTSVKFALDGKRLLSCGGDKTIVFNEVNGPNISRVKSVNTSHGTIMGLAIDATNKYAATTGQDKKLNIWNIKTGKFMRAYKHPDIQSELYKCDIDPSGMYVAACTFDKKICIFDFFSGNLMTYIDSGHAELITSIRFSPNGKHLLTVAGDGCIMIWKIGTDLVNSMQDRIVELYTSVRKKQQEQLHQLQMRASSASMPSPPRQSVNSIDMGAGFNGNNPNFPPAPPAPFPDVQAQGKTAKARPGAVPGKGAWADRQPAVAEGNFAMFGRNVASSVDDSQERHKLTLELTANAYLEGDELGPRTRTLVPPPTQSQNPSLVPPSSLSRSRDMGGVSSSAVSALTASTISDGDCTLDDELDAPDRGYGSSPGNTQSEGIAGGFSSPNNSSNDALSRSTSGRLAHSMEDRFDDVMRGESDAEPDAHLYDSPSEDEDEGGGDGDTVTVDMTPPRKAQGAEKQKPTDMNAGGGGKGIAGAGADSSQANFSDEEDEVYGDTRSFTKGTYTITPRTKHALDKLELTKGVKASMQEGASVSEDDDDLKGERDTLSKFDTLEHSVSELENWLEDKLRQDTAADEGATAAAGDAASKAYSSASKNKTQPIPSRVDQIADAGTDMKKSLSSDFFKKHLSSSNKSAGVSSSVNSTPGRSAKEVLAGVNQKAKAQAQVQAQAQQSNESTANIVSAAMPPRPPDGPAVDLLNMSSASTNSIGNRSIETAAAVSIMRDKLLNMGIIPEGKVTKKMKTSHGGESADTSVDRSSLPLPPKPPTPAETTAARTEEKPSLSMSSDTPIGVDKVSAEIASTANDTDTVSDGKPAPTQSYEHKQHKSRSSLEFTQESYLADTFETADNSTANFDESVAVEVDERDGYLGRNVHNNSLLTDDSGENHHVFSFGDSEDEGEGEEEEEVDSVHQSVNDSTVGSTAGPVDSDNSGIDLLATAASAMALGDTNPAGAKDGDGGNPDEEVVSEEAVQQKATECRAAME